MGASCDGCPNFKQWQESRGEFWGAPCSEPMIDCKAIDDAPSELADKLIEYFENNSDEGCPLFSNNSEKDKHSCKNCDYFTCWPDESRECAIIKGNYYGNLTKVKECFDKDNITNCPCFVEIKNEDNSRD